MTAVPLPTEIAESQPSTPRESYLSQSRRPLAAAAIVVPLAIAYEVGTRLFHVDPTFATETRVLAFVWLRDVLTPGAPGGVNAAWLVPAAAVVALLAWHVFAGHSWRLRPTVPAGMACEAFVLALPLLALALVAGNAHHFGLAAATSARDVAGDLVLAAGAGVFEEFVFRLAGFAVLHALLAPALGERLALATTLVATSLAFAGYHHLPATGEPFAWPAFAFRTAAGAWLGIVFLVRGFGLSVGCHAAHNTLVAVLPLLLTATK